jgi:hypothetical protein
MSWISSATAGSPRKPMPIEATVIPTWHADSASEMSSSWRTTLAAALSPSAASCSIRARLTRTSANSAATKKPFSAISTNSRARRTALIGALPGVYAAAYFEGVRRLSSATGSR